MNTVKRRDCLKALGASAALLAMPEYMNAMSLFEDENQDQKQPNVILVITDDQGYGDLACHGNPIIRTPNIDRFFTQSIRLTNFHVGPSCSPTRAGLMTGHYCNRTGVWHTVMGRSLLRKDELTMSDVFSANGYKTGIFGKWHLGDNYPFRPQDRGFDEVMVHGGGGIGSIPDFWNNDYFDDTFWHNGKPKKFKGYCTDIWFDGAMKFIEANKDRPFFCYLTTNAPHGPYNVDEKYSKPYLDNGVPDVRARFYGMITNIDENMARLESKLNELGISDNTIFIYMTDNGTSTGVNVDSDGFPTDNGFNAGMRGKKGSEYDGGHRVPCFIRWADGGITGGRNVDRLTSHVDLLPTLIDLCGLKSPRSVEFDGESITSLIRGKGENWQDRTLVTDSQRIEHPEKWRKSSTMTDRWRLINGTELYDIKADPGQKKDVAGEHPEVVSKLREAYEEWWADVSQRFDEYCEIIIGSDKENPVRLTSHDWHNGGLPPWHQVHVRNGQQTNGFWALDVMHSGTYEFSLRRWPEEIDKPITAAIPGGSLIPGGEPYPEGKAINIIKARLKVGNVDETKAVTKGMSAVTFRVRLKAGKTRLETWLTDDEGNSRGAYFVYIKYIA